MQQHGDSSDASVGRDDSTGAPMPPRPRRSAYYFPGDDKHPVLITEAAPSLEDQHRARVRRYLTIMSFRIPALILAAVAYSVFSNALISILIIVASIPLPWIAVLIANDRPPRDKNEPSRWDRPRPALESRPHNAIDR